MAKSFDIGDLVRLTGLRYKSRTRSGCDDTIYDGKNDTLKFTTHSWPADGTAITLEYHLSFVGELDWHKDDPICYMIPAQHFPGLIG